MKKEISKCLSILSSLSCLLETETDIEYEKNKLEKIENEIILSEHEFHDVSEEHLDDLKNKMKNIKDRIDALDIFFEDSIKLFWKLSVELKTHMKEYKRLKEKCFLEQNNIEDELNAKKQIQTKINKLEKVSKEFIEDLTAGILELDISNIHPSNQFEVLYKELVSLIKRITINIIAFYNTKGFVPYPKKCLNLIVSLQNIVNSCLDIEIFISQGLFDLNEKDLINDFLNLWLEILVKINHNEQVTEELGNECTFYLENMLNIPALAEKYSSKDVDLLCFYGNHDGKIQKIRRILLRKE